MIKRAFYAVAGFAVGWMIQQIFDEAQFRDSCLHSGRDPRATDYTRIR